MPHRPDIFTRWTLPASLLLHGALAGLLLLNGPRVLNQPPVRAIIVDLLPAPAEPVPQPVAPPPALPAPALPSPVALRLPAVTAPIDDEDRVAATDFYAAGIMADPANAEVRENFALLASSEQVIQLCNIEALEQLHSARPAIPADTLVGYAFSDIALHDHELDAEGSAVRSAGKWFHFQYHCAVASDATRVSAFDYAMGPAIPPEQWEEHFLNASDEGLD